MSADMRLEEPGLSGLGGSGLEGLDEPAFSGLAERHRRELHVHCYRMLGSFDLQSLDVPDRHQRLLGLHLVPATVMIPTLARSLRSHVE